MRTSGLLGALLLLMPVPAAAQDASEAADAGTGEVVVTGARREIDGYDERVPAVGLRRRADFAILQVTVTGDTREAADRRREMYATIRGAIELAGKRDIRLATGGTVIEPLTLANFQDLSFRADNRPDTERVSFLIKSPLDGTTDAKTVIARMDAFIKAVPRVGRALIAASDDLTLSVVNPDQYRGEIASLVAADAKATAARFGPDYGVQAHGVDRPVEWVRAGLTDVLLYVPYQLTVLPL